MSGRLIVLSGPSAVGKGSLVAVLRTLVPDVWVSVSCTTRAPRPGETDGIEYRFLDRDQFARMRAAHEFLESDEHFGNWYGTPRQPVLDHLVQGIPTLLEIDLEGARQVRRTMPDAQYLFLAPPSVDELVRRMGTRGTESPDAVAGRLARARLEMAAQDEFGAVVVNDDLERAAREIADLITGPAD